MEYSGTWNNVVGGWLSHRILFKSGEGLCVERLPAQFPLCPGLSPALHSPLAGCHKAWNATANISL